jgi:hypothetical protein
MHFLFNLLRIMDLYKFRALLAHPQQLLHIWNFEYCVRVVSVDFARFKVELVSSTLILVPLVQNFLRISK